MGEGYKNRKKAKELNENGLDFETQSFVNHYLLNGQNGKLAFCAVRTDYDEHAAEVRSMQLLKRPEVKKYINQVLNETIDIKNIQLTYLIYVCKKTISSIERQPADKRDYSSLLKAVDQLAKLGKMYNDKQTVNINNNGAINISFGDWTPKQESIKPSESLVVDAEFTEIKNEVLALNNKEIKQTKKYKKLTPAQKAEEKRKIDLVKQIREGTSNGR